MILPDVNVLVYAYNRAEPQHKVYNAWLDTVLTSNAAFGMCDMVLSGFIRIVTNPRTLKAPLSINTALDIAGDLRQHPNCLIIEPQKRHWHIFTKLCKHTRATGNAVPDAYLAALAIESGSEFVTADRGFARFPNLRWRHPLT